MSGNWQAPGQGSFEDSPPPGAPGYPNPAYPSAYPAAPGYVPDWGLAQPMPGYQPVMWVPRPPRPGSLNLAIALSVLGIVVSGIQQVVSLSWLYSHRNLLTTGINNQNTGATPFAFVSAALDVIVIISIVVWLIPVVGVVVTSVLSMRGANAARIVLACLMGVFALDNICGGISTLSGVFTTGTFQAERGPALTPYLQLLLAGLAILIGVLLLLPSTNRFLSAGAGRRFMPSK
jgi:hypothetical protein